MLDAHRISVTTDRTIPSGQRIDVVVEFVGASGRTGCLAIENKPFAEDQANQVRDYFGYLDEKYAEWFLLLYLSPAGEGPSKSSLGTDELGEKWKHRFAIVPYVEDREGRSDAFDDVRARYSIVQRF